MQENAKAGTSILLILHNKRSDHDAANSTAQVKRSAVIAHKQYLTGKQNHLKEPTCTRQQRKHSPPSSASFLPPC
jgi:hypothetical protein